MVSNDTERIPTGYPIKFIAPLPLEECTNFIRASFDKRMGMSFAHMQGHLEKIDDSTYEFSLYQNLKHWRETVSGRFIAQSKSTTLIEASFSRGSSRISMMPEQEKFLLPIIIIAIGACGLMTPMPWGLIIPISLFFMIGFILYTNKKRQTSPPKPMPPPASELLWYFERNLKN